jgi:hypothetical protein
MTDGYIMLPLTADEVVMLEHCLSYCWLINATEHPKDCGESKIANTIVHLLDRLTQAVERDDG